ncbi:hypothetical protein AMTRI_Chr13g88110 [Amborella trichopoda]
MLEKQMGRFLLLPFINNNQCKLHLTNAYSQRWRWLYLEEGRAFNCGNCFNPLSQIKEQQQVPISPTFRPFFWAFSRITQFATSASLEARKENYYRSIFPLSRFSTALEFGVKGESAHSRILDNHEMEGKENIIKPMVEFSKVDIGMLPSAILVGRPNVGKSALFNRLIRRREALVYNTLDDHVTRDIREGVAKLGDLRFKVLDSAGLEMVATSGSILDRTAGMTANVLARSHFAIFLTDARDGLQPLDLEVGKWLRKNAPGIRIVLVMNKSESLDEHSGSLTGVVAEAHSLGFGDPIPISAETGFGMVELYEALRPLLEEYMIQKMEGIPVVFVSALEGRGRTTIMKRVVEIYEKWCLRLPTARLNCWLRKVMSRHSWKDQAAQPKIKYFTQVKARPPTFVAFVSGSTELAGTEIRFFAKSLKEDFNLGGIPIRITQRCVPRNRDRSLQKSSSAKANTKSNTKTQCSFTSDKRMLSCD